jgi:hypothetical protein
MLQLTGVGRRFMRWLLDGWAGWPVNSRIIHKWVRSAWGWHVVAVPPNAAP